MLFLIFSQGRLQDCVQFGLGTLHAYPVPKAANRSHQCEKIRIGASLNTKGIQSAY